MIPKQQTIAGLGGLHSTRLPNDADFSLVLDESTDPNTASAFTFDPALDSSARSSAARLSVESRPGFFRGPPADRSSSSHEFDTPIPLTHFHHFHHFHPIKAYCYSSPRDGEVTRREELALRWVFFGNVHCLLSRGRAVPRSARGLHRST